LLDSGPKGSRMGLKIISGAAGQLMSAGP
jgi:hypothetical protein